MESMNLGVSEQYEDIVSSLPHHVAHRILFLLNIKDIAKLSLASKKCGNLCLTVPSLRIRDCENSEARIQFLDFLLFDTSTIISLNINAPNLLILHCPEICLDDFTVKKSELKYVVRLFLSETCPIRNDEFHSLLASIAQVTKFTTESSSIQEIPLDNNETSRFDFKFWESLKFSFVDGLEDVDIAPQFNHGRLRSILLDYNQETVLISSVDDWFGMVLIILVDGMEALEFCEAAGQDDRDEWQNKLVIPLLTE
ncbi:hypothetical protein ACFE04_008639 [Oxalis oulophora]